MDPEYYTPVTRYPVPVLNRLLIVFGMLMLVASFAWLTGRVKNFGAHPEGSINTLVSSQGFSGLDLAISKEEAEKVFDAAQAAMLLHGKHSEQSRGWSDVATWTAFALTSIITILAGLLGYIDPTRPTAAVAKPGWYKNNKTIATIVGTLAALATISTGMSTKFKESAESERKRSIEVRDSLVSAYKDLAKTKSVTDTRAILERLRSDSQL